MALLLAYSPMVWPLSLPAVQAAMSATLRLDGTMHNRLTAAQQCCDGADALAFLPVQPSRFGSLRRLERMLAPKVLAALLRLNHTGNDPFADQLAFEFCDLRHHAEHQPPGRRLQIDAQGGDDDANAPGI